MRSTVKVKEVEAAPLEMVWIPAKGPCPYCDRPAEDHMIVKVDDVAYVRACDRVPAGAVPATPMDLAVAIAGGQIKQSPA